MADKYISVKAAETAAHKAFCKYENALQYAEMIHQLSKIPAADVVERKRGEWVKAKGSWCTPGGDPVWECSECGKGRHVYGIEHGTYGADVADGQWVSCPNCGASMRKDGDV